MLGHWFDAELDIELEFDCAPSRAARSMVATGIIVTMTAMRMAFIIVRVRPLSNLDGF